MGDGEGRDDHQQRAKPAKWNHEAKQKQQVIRSVQNVPEARGDESRSRLIPSRIKTNEAGIAFELERSNDSILRQESKNRDYSNAEPGKRRANGEPRTL